MKKWLKDFMRKPEFEIDNTADSLSASTLETPQEQDISHSQFEGPADGAVSPPRSDEVFIPSPVRLYDLPLIFEVEQQPPHWEAALPELITFDQQAPYDGSHTAIKIPAGPHASKWLHIPRNMTQKEKAGIAQSILQIWDRCDFPFTAPKPATVSPASEGLDLSDTPYHTIPSGTWKVLGPPGAAFPMTNSPLAPFACPHTMLYNTGKFFNSWFLHIPRYLTSDEIKIAETNLLELCNKPWNWGDRHGVDDPANIQQDVDEWWLCVEFRIAQRETMDLLYRDLKIDFPAQQDPYGIWGQQPYLWDELPNAFEENFTHRTRVRSSSLPNLPIFPPETVPGSEVAMSRGSSEEADWDKVILPDDFGELILHLDATLKATKSDSSASDASDEVVVPPVAPKPPNGYWGLGFRVGSESELATSSETLSEMGTLEDEVVSSVVEVRASQGSPFIRARTGGSDAAATTSRGGDTIDVNDDDGKYQHDLKEVCGDSFVIDKDPGFNSAMAKLVNVRGLPTSRNHAVAKQHGGERRNEHAREGRNAIEGAQFTSTLNSPLLEDQRGSGIQESNILRQGDEADAQIIIIERLQNRSGTSNTLLVSSPLDTFSEEAEMDNEREHLQSIGEQITALGEGIDGARNTGEHGNTVAGTYTAHPPDAVQDQQSRKKRQSVESQSTTCTKFFKPGGPVAPISPDVHPNNDIRALQSFISDNTASKRASLIGKGITNKNDMPLIWDDRFQVLEAGYSTLGTNIRGTSTQDNHFNPGDHTGNTSSQQNLLTRVNAGIPKRQGGDSRVGKFARSPRAPHFVATASWNNRLAPMRNVVYLISILVCGYEVFNVYQGLAIAVPILKDYDHQIPARLWDLQGRLLGRDTWPRDLSDIQEFLSPIAKDFVELARLLGEMLQSNSMHVTSGVLAFYILTFYEVRRAPLTGVLILGFAVVLHVVS